MTTVRQAIHTDQAPKAIGPYSQAVRVGDTVYMAGQIPLDPATMQMVEGDFEKEARRVFENIKAVIAASGGTLRAGREGHHLPHRLRELRQGQRAHGAVLQGALSGALDGGGGGAAAQRARRDRVHAAPGLKPRTVATPAPQVVYEQRPVASLRGVGPALAEKLAKLGVTQVQDLLFVLPSRYEDRTQVSEPSAACVPARARWSKAKSSSPKWPIAAAASCCAASPMAPAR